MALDYIVWNGNKSSDVANLIVRKNIVHNFAGVRTTEKSSRGKNDISITNDGIAPIDITVEFMLTGTPEFAYKTGREALEKFFFDSKTNYENMLYFDEDDEWFYDAHIVNAISVEKMLDLKTFSVVFRCNGAKRKFDSSLTYPKIPYIYKQLTFEEEWQISVDDHYISRKPKVVIAFSSTAVKGTSISIKFLSSITSTNLIKGYLGRLITINMPRMATQTGVTKPVLVLDFENDDYYVCDGTITTNPLDCLDKNNSLGSIVPYMLYMNGTLGDTCDYYCNGKTATLQTQPIAYWHDIIFRGSDSVTISTPSHTTNLTAYVFYFPEERTK